MRMIERRLRIRSAAVLIGAIVLFVASRAGAQTELPPPPPPDNAGADVTVTTPPPPAVEVEAADVEPSAVVQFREPLSPSGSWVDDPTYGTVWVPSREVVGESFTPYSTAGHWVLDNDSHYVWVS